MEGCDGVLDGLTLEAFIFEEVGNILVGEAGHPVRYDPKDGLGGGLSSTNAINAIMLRSMRLFSSGSFE